jgi:hypothetical protein
MKVPLHSHPYRFASSPKQRLRPSRTNINLTLFWGAVACVLWTVLVGSFAYAQDPMPIFPPQPVLPNPNPATLVAILSALASALRSDNTILPIQLTTLQRAILVGAVTAGAAFTLAVTTDVPWQQALPGMLSAGLLAFLTHGARVTPGATPEEAVRQKSGAPKKAAPGAEVVPPVPAHDPIPVSVETERKTPPDGTKPPGT